MRQHSDQHAGRTRGALGRIRVSECSSSLCFSFSKLLLFSEVFRYYPSEVYILDTKASLLVEIQM